MKSANNRGGDLKAIGSLDRLVHEPARLMIMALLYVVESADFTFLMSQTGLTWGNLSSHLSKLEAGGYIQVEKEFVERKPHTMLHLTEAGRQAFRDYRRNVVRFFEDLPD
jgi:DNA-binding MarR family transcriptional regulator